MKLQKDMFTQQQYVAILNLYDYFYRCNNDVKSNCKVEGIQTFIDKQGDFFCAYAFLTFKDGGLNTSLEYYQIDKKGDKIDLTKLYSDYESIVKRLNKMQEIKL